MRNRADGKVDNGGLGLVEINHAGVLKPCVMAVSLAHVQ